MSNRIFSRSNSKAIEKIKSDIAGSPSRAKENVKA
jgi:hypothetical protein